MIRVSADVIHPSVRQVDVDGCSMHYAEQGDGRPLVLVHGSLSDYRYWAAQMRPLSERYRVIAPSLRHHYPQARDGCTATYGVDRHAADLCAFVERVCGGRAHVVAHSRGAHVVVLAAAQRPELFSALVLADPAIPVLRDGVPLLTVPAPGEARRLALDRIRTGDIDGGLECFVDAVSGAGVWNRLNTRRRQMARDNARTLPAQYDDPGLARPVAGLQSLAMPVLLIGGEKSPAPYPVILEHLQAALPGARRTTLARTSHAMNAEDPAAFNELLLAFLTELDAR